MIGRAFSPDDDQAGCASPGAVVSYAFWSRELGGDPGALGRTLSLDGRRFPVIGVTAPEVIVAEGLQTGPEQREKAMQGALQAVTALKAA